MVICLSLCLGAGILCVYGCIHDYRDTKHKDIYNTLGDYIAHYAVTYFFMVGMIVCLCAFVDNA
jgi:hypothetical protein